VTSSPPLIVVAGATATGKTGLAIRLAEWIAGQGRPAEIISADSRQVFRGLDIGTAKVTAVEQARVPHHGLDLVDPDEPFSVAQFVRHARTALAGISERDGVAILAGGTGLYLRAIARGLDADALPNDPEVRARLETELAAHGLDPLVDRLRQLAPTRAGQIDVRNPRRVVRALEIAELRGDAGVPEHFGYDGPVAWLGLTVNRAVHERWIAERARAQFDAGLIDEAKALRERFDPSLPCFSAIGYREAWGVLDGELTRDAAIELDVKRNVAFAKRQRTWFRSESRIRWIDSTTNFPDDAAHAVVRQLLPAIDAPHPRA
jgi:tRNA dimethylallyltransferase